MIKYFILKRSSAKSVWNFAQEELSSRSNVNSYLNIHWCFRKKNKLGEIVIFTHLELMHKANDTGKGILKIATIMYIILPFGI